MKSMLKITALMAGLLAGLAGCDNEGPKIGLQAWTFRNLTFFETVDQAQKLGIACLEAYPGQTLGGGLEGKFGPGMNAATRQRVLDKLNSAQVTLVSFGVVNAGGEQQWREIFAFAKELNLQWVTTEPPLDKLPMLDKLANEYGIPVAIHNHGKPSPYADPEATKAALATLSPMVGVCADTGHWAKSGFEPAQALSLLAGRIITLHLKDESEFAKGGRDVPFGTGVANMGGMLAELKKQKFKGVALIEYEHMSPNLENEVAACVEYLKRTDSSSVKQLTGGEIVPPGMSAKVAGVWAQGGGKDSKKWAEPQELFKPDLSNAEFKPGSWTYENGIISAKGGGELWTTESYGDFVLSLEFRCEEGTNSGVFLRCSDPANWLHSAIEVQILQGDAPDGKQACGAIFDCLAPSRILPIAAGKWHSYVITAKDGNISVILDGEKVTKMNLDDWTQPHKNPDGTPNKFNKAYKDLARSGRIGFQYHGMPIQFRNIRIEKL
jgi:sugar phosphate isomerase/epimerase